MRERCNNPKHMNYRFYGGRGIKCCDRWSSFELFLQDMGDKPCGFTLERIDNDCDYEPSNCKWASRKAQANNRRSNRKVTVNCDTRTPEEWSEEVGLPGNVIRRRLLRRWNPKDAISTPAREKVSLTVQGVTKSLSEWAEISGISRDTLRGRIRLGYSPEEAVTTPLHQKRKVDVTK